MLVSGGYCQSVMIIRCLKQILSDLLWKQCPPKKLPWTEDVEDDLETSAENFMSSKEKFQILFFDTI